MKQDDLYDLAIRCGCAVTVSFRSSGFFSSWSINMKKNENSYMIEHDGRDGWLIFYQESEPNKYREIDKKISHTMRENEKLNQCEYWLLSV
ncbi:hypothetical protein K5D33_25295 [Pseudomonas cichorii]|nr:hypothetical protein [Pseudomonas cichorii]MBX8538022.1 hypothetical protein [Pseudomonas cichorii]